MGTKPTLLATVSTLALTGIACAAGPAMAAAPAPVPADWTGFYAGVNAGAPWNLASADVTDAVSDHTKASVDSGGAMFGVQAGYNWQSGDYLFGAEADWDYADASGFENLPINPEFKFTSRLSSLATVRGRFGIVCPDTLYYLTAGLAIGRVDNKIPPGTYLFNGGYPPDNATKTGWTVGGGVEHVIAPHWTIKAEALYADLGDSSVQGYLGSGYTFRTSNEAVIARVGLNYKF